MSKRSGYYSQRCSGGADLVAFYFKRSVLDPFRADPRYIVGESSLSCNESNVAPGEETGWLQQYIGATGNNGEPAIMVILAHLNWLTESEQNWFKSNELPSGHISMEMIKPVLRGRPPATISPIYALSSALECANELAGFKMFRITRGAHLV